MAANALRRLRRSLALTSSILNHSNPFSTILQSVAPTSSSPATNPQNPSTTFDVNDQSNYRSNLSFQLISSRAISSRPSYNDDYMEGDEISPDDGPYEYDDDDDDVPFNESEDDVPSKESEEDSVSPFEGCDENHWLIVMHFPKDPKPSSEEMVETYVQTAAKVLGSVEEAKKKIYACSTTTYNGFHVEVSEQVSEKFLGLPGVMFVLLDSYVDNVNKEYGGDRYINGTIIPRPPPDWCV